MVILGLTLLMGLPPSTASALPPVTWTLGQEYEYEIFGHYFTEEYWTNDSLTLGTGIEILENAIIHVGDDDERACEIGTRGTYDLINETTNPWTTVNSSLPAYAALLHAQWTRFWFSGSCPPPPTCWPPPPML